jgi:hypothetical protein
LLACLRLPLPTLLTDLKAWKQKRSDVGKVLLETPGVMRVPGNPLIKGTFWLDDVQLAAVSTAESNHRLNWPVLAGDSVCGAGFDGGERRNSSRFLRLEIPGHPPRIEPDDDQDVER